MNQIKLKLFLANETALDLSVLPDTKPAVSKHRLEFQQMENYYIHSIVTLTAEWMAIQYFLKHNLKQMHLYSQTYNIGFNYHT